MFLAALVLGCPPPLAAVQILRIDFVTEGTATAKLVMEPAEGDEMRLEPISAKEPLLTRSLVGRIAFLTPAIAMPTLGWFMYPLSVAVPFAQVETETFTLLAACQRFNVRSCRSDQRSGSSWSILGNPWLVGGLSLSKLLEVAVVFYRPLGGMFHMVPSSRDEVVAIGAVASLVVRVEEARRSAPATARRPGPASRSGFPGPMASSVRSSSRRRGPGGGLLGASDPTHADAVRSLLASALSERSTDHSGTAAAGLRSLR